MIGKVVVGLIATVGTEVMINRVIPNLILKYRRHKVKKEVDDLKNQSNRKVQE
jgi:hypothetical protein